MTHETTPPVRILADELLTELDAETSEQPTVFGFTVKEAAQTSATTLRREQAPEALLAQPAAPVAVPDEREAFEAWQRRGGHKRPEDAGEWEAWQARALLAAPVAVPAIDVVQTGATNWPGGHVPDGWKLVSVEPTQEMWAASGDAVVRLTNIGIHHDIVSRVVYDAMLAAAPTPPAQPVAVPDGEAIREAIREALGDAYDCTRVWSAWGYGTMSQNDFESVAGNDERVDEIACAVEQVISAAPTPQAGPWESPCTPPAQPVVVPDENGLLPCPFCGGKAELHQRETESLWSHNQVTWSQVGCCECECVGADCCEDDDGSEAVAHWNTRAAAPSAPAPPAQQQNQQQNIPKIIPAVVPVAVPDGRALLQALEQVHSGHIVGHDQSDQPKGGFSDGYVNGYGGCIESVRILLAAAPTPPVQQPVALRFPTMLRKMWSGGDVQAWLDQQGPLYAAPPAPEQAEQPIKWGSAGTVGNLIAQLKAMDPAMPIYASQRIEDRTMLKGVITSYEHGDGRFIIKGGSQKCVVIWTNPDDRQAEQGVVKVPTETLRKIHRDLDACQRVIHFAGGFDPAYVKDAQERLKEIDELLEVGK